VRAEERHRGTGFLRVHGAPDDPLGIDDAYEAALVLLPPSAWQRGREQDTPTIKLAADIVEHKGPGQRHNRNRLAFLAVDQAALEDIQNVVRKKLAWASIVRDARGILQLPPAQEDDAKKKLAEQETAALNAVRRGWKHLLLPQEPQPASPNAARGFDLEPVALTNRGGDPTPLVTYVRFRGRTWVDALQMSAFDPKRTSEAEEILWCSRRRRSSWPLIAAAQPSARPRNKEKARNARGPAEKCDWVHRASHKKALLTATRRSTPRTLLPRKISLCVPALATGSPIRPFMTSAVQRWSVLIRQLPIKGIG
jgi:hypothetical protein